MRIIRTICVSEEDKHGLSVMACKTDGHQPYVVWLVSNDGARHHGWYSSTAEQCLRDYLERCGLNKVEP